MAFEIVEEPGERDGAPGRSARAAPGRAPVRAGVVFRLSRATGRPAAAVVFLGRLAPAGERAAAGRATAADRAALAGALGRDWARAFEPGRWAARGGAGPDDREFGEPLERDGERGAERGDPAGDELASEALGRLRASRGAPALTADAIDFGLARDHDDGEAGEAEPDGDGEAEEAEGGPDGRPAAAARPWEGVVVSALELGGGGARETPWELARKVFAATGLAPQRLAFVERAGAGWRTVHLVDGEPAEVSEGGRGGPGGHGERGVEVLPGLWVPAAAADARPAIEPRAFGAPAPWHHAWDLCDFLPRGRPGLAAAAADEYRRDLLYGGFVARGWPFATRADAAALLAGRAPAGAGGGGRRAAARAEAALARIAAEAARPGEPAVTQFAAAAALGARADLRAAFERFGGPGARGAWAPLAARVTFAAADYDEAAAGWVSASKADPEAALGPRRAEVLRLAAPAAGARLEALVVERPAAGPAARSMGALARVELTRDALAAAAELPADRRAGPAAALALARAAAAAVHPAGARATLRRLTAAHFEPGALGPAAARALLDDLRRFDAAGAPLGPGEFEVWRGLPGAPFAAGEPPPPPARPPRVRVTPRTADVRVEVEAAPADWARVAGAVAGAVAAAARAAGRAREARPLGAGRLRRLQEADPELFDLRRHDPAAGVYSVLCQAGRQPAVVTEAEARAARLRPVRYWNFTEGRPALYVCPDPRYPHLSLRAGEHPRGYCLPCCKKVGPRSAAAAEAERACLARRAPDEAAVSRHAAQHLLAYGKALPPGRLGELPRQLAEGALAGAAPHPFRPCAVGVRDSAPGVHAAQLAFAVERALSELAAAPLAALAAAAAAAPPAAAAALGGGAGALFNDGAALGEAILDAFVRDAPLGPFSAGPAAAAWPALLADLAYAAFGVEVLVADDPGGGGDVAIGALTGRPARPGPVALLVRSPAGVYPVAVASPTFFARVPLELQWMAARAVFRPLPAGAAVGEGRRRASRRAAKRAARHAARSAKRAPGHDDESDDDDEDDDRRARYAANRRAARAAARGEAETRRAAREQPVAEPTYVPDDVHNLLRRALAHAPAPPAAADWAARLRAAGFGVSAYRVGGAGLCYGLDAERAGARLFVPVPACVAAADGTPVEHGAREAAGPPAAVRAAAAALGATPGRALALAGRAVGFEAEFGGPWPLAAPTLEVAPQTLRFWHDDDGPAPAGALALAADPAAVDRAVVATRAARARGPRPRPPAEAAALRAAHLYRLFAAEVAAAVDAGELDPAAAPPAAVRRAVAARVEVVPAGAAPRPPGNAFEACSAPGDAETRAHCESGRLPVTAAELADLCALAAADLADPLRRAVVTRARAGVVELHRFRPWGT